jgi:stringent starvation protein B
MIPTVATVNGVDTVVRYSSGQITLNIAPDSTLQERKDLLAYMANFLGLATVKTSVENVEPFY